MAYPLFHEAGPRDLPMALLPQQFAAEFPGEGDFVEFKQGLPETKLREAIVAFSNTDGGVVLLGVRDDGQVQGITSDGETIAKIHRSVAGVRNPGRYDVRSLLIGDRTILVLSVRRRREGFAQMQDGRILVRRGAMNAPVFDIELARFISQRALTRFESTPVEATLDDADGVLIARLRGAYGWSTDHLADRLAEAGLLEIGDAAAHLTVAGALYLLSRPAEVLGKAYVEVFRYRDESGTYDRRLEIDGPVDQQVEQTTRELMAELGSDVVVLGVRRHEFPRIPEPVLREAIANAVAHRTYEATGQPVRIEIRPDRVIVRSPGGLPEPVTLANMREQNSARNVDVIRVLRRFRLAEDAGMGVDVMEDVMEAALLERPEFDADGAHVEVVLRLGSTVAPRERAWIAEVEQRGEIRMGDRILLLHAARGEVLTNGSVRELLGVDSVQARSSLHRLRDLGYLSQRGQRGGAFYALAKGLAPPAGLQLDDVELREVILGMAADQNVTNESVRTRTGLDRAQVLALLTALVESGELVRHGERRGTNYTRASTSSPSSSGAATIEQ
jgi:ATP-dependent DNA helicase RecG